MFKHIVRRSMTPLLVASFLVLSPGSTSRLRAQQPSDRASIIHKIQAEAERLEMTVNTSRRLTLDQKIVEAQVSNPDILGVTPLSPNMIQISAKTAGVTQVNLWGEDKRLYTIDVIVFADAQALQMLLQSQFPNASLKVIPVNNGVLLSGYVDQPEHVDLIVRIAEEYYPKVINNMTVSGVQQVLLRVKVMEVSRTKLRRLGFDFAKITNGNLIFSGISGLISSVSGSAVATSGTETFAFSVIDGNSAFFGVLEALRQDNLAKVLAEPNLVAVSGRPAFFNSGGEIPIPVPQSLGTISIEYKKYGTQLDFVPIVLGNGRVRLEVRPRVSEIDPSRSVTIDSTTVPGLRVREVETGVEMMAGQTLAIAGLVQTRVESENRGLPWISEVPYLGVPFRKVGSLENEIELLIMVTPELVEALDSCEVPPCGPGTMTTTPNDCELFLKGHLEVPKCCPPGGPGCDACGPAGRPNGEVPPEGMILQQHEEIPNPQPSTSYNRYPRFKQQVAKADRRWADPNAEPTFLGPVGYDVK